MFVLLYEFLAETRLKVYRQLNIDTQCLLSSSGRTTKAPPLAQAKRTTTLRVSRAEIWLTVYRATADQNSIQLGQSGAAHADADDLV